MALLKVIRIYGFDQYLPLHSNMLLSPILSASLSISQLSLLPYISKNNKILFSNIRNMSNNTRQSSCVTARGVPPVPPASKSFQNVCPFFVQHFCPHLRGVPPGAPSVQGGTPVGGTPQFRIGRVLLGAPPDLDPDLDLEGVGPPTLTQTLSAGWGPPGP